MLNRTIALTRIFFKSLFSKSSDKKKIGRYILYGAAMIYLLGMMVVFSRYMIGLLKQVRQTQVFVGLILGANIFMTLFLTIVASLNVLYFSSDNLSVLPLPVRPMEIMAAKLNTLLAYEYIEEIILGLIPLTVFGIMTSQPVAYYLLMIPVLLTIPVLPLCLACFVIIAVMSVSGKLRNKNISQYLTMLLGIGLSVGLSLFINRNSDDEQMLVMLFKANGFLEKFRALLPTLRFGIDTLIKRDLLSLLLLIVTSVIIYTVTVLTSEKLYFKGMLGSLFSSAGISSKKIDEKKAFRDRGLTWSYVVKEFKTYLRRPVFMVQLVLPSLLLPFLMGFLMYSSFKSGFEEGGMDFQAVLTDGYTDPAISPYLFGAVLMMVFFNTIYTMVSVVAVSKDGQDALFMKTIPVPFWKQVFYKALPDILMVIASSLLMILFGVFLYKVPLSMIALAILILVPYAFLHGALIIFDLKAPKLTWSNDMEIVKRNLRMLIPVGVGLGNIALIAVMVFVLKYTPLTLTLILTAAYSLVAFLLWFFIYKKNFKLADAIL